MLIVAFFSMLNSKYIAAFYMYWTDLCVNLLVVSVLQMIIQREKKWQEKKKVLEPFGGAVLCVGRRVQNWWEGWEQATSCYVSSWQLTN